MKESRFQLKNNTHVWVLNANSQKQHLELFYDVLSEDEKNKADKFRFEKDKDISIIARGTLRILLGKYLSISPKTFVFKYGEFGKPNIDNVQNLKFNISHSKELIVLGFVKNSEIGIDVEYCKRDFDVMDIVDNYFSKKEIEVIQNIPKKQQIEAFYRGWTRKEAFIKANARGLSFPLNSFSLSIESDNHTKLLETLWNPDEKNSWSIIPFKTLPDYKAALAVKGETNSVNFFEFQSDLINDL